MCPRRYSSEESMKVSLSQLQKMVLMYISDFSWPDDFNHINLLLVAILSQEEPFTAKKYDPRVSRNFWTWSAPWEKFLILLMALFLLRK